MTDVITAESVIKSTKKRVDELSTTTSKTILPTFTKQTEAQEEANQLNFINQSVIGTKEGVVGAVSKLVGSNITDVILRTADGSNYKSINDFTLYKVMKVGIDRANRPSMNDVLEHLIEVINHTSSRSHCWPTSRQPPKPIMGTNFDLPCMLSARSTHTITYMMQRCSKLF